MGMNDTPSSERVHIGFFGRRNAGKSSLLNAVTGQELAVVSEVQGTTTDPVYKAMELLPVGPVVIIDTPGFDDEGSLGELRVKKARQVLNKTDVAVLVADCSVGLSTPEQELIRLFEKKMIPYLVVYNKCDLAMPVSPSASISADPAMQDSSSSGTGADPAMQGSSSSGIGADLATSGSLPADTGADRPGVRRGQPLYVSALQKTHIYDLKDAIAALAKENESSRRLVGDLVDPGDVAVLVTPIDSAAPKGRLILPQQQVIRDLLERGAVSVVVRETELETALSSLGRKPKLVITDSQAFARVDRETPDDIYLTSFSILMARYKGTLLPAVQGAGQISRLADGDTVLLCEGCTHHRQCGDIGTVKLPAWLSNYTGKQLQFVFTSGTEFPEDLSPYRLVIHCGSCMLNEREMRFRLQSAADAGVPMTNYGTAIACMHGILERSLQILPEFREGIDALH